MNTELRELILKLIEKNSRLAIHDLAVMLDVAETEVANEIADMEKEHNICGYHTLINWDNTSKDQLTAMIEVKVTPQRGQGFDRIAERIYNFPEVKAVYLMSGGYDIMVMIEGKTMKEISMFTSSKLAPLEPSGIRKFFDIVSEMPDAISLGVGEPDFDTPWRVREEGIYSLERGRTFYTSNAGLKELRYEISEYLERKYELVYDPNHEIIVTVGGSEGIDIAMRTILDPGDEVIVVQPCFVSYVACVVMAGGTPVIVSLKEEDKFKLKKEQLEAAVTDKTKAMIISFPNNPTGAIMTKEELEPIAEFAKEHDIVVISDEIYSELTYGRDHVSIASLPEMKDRSIVINGFSKAFAMTGWRLGYVAAPRYMMKQMVKVHQFCIMAAPTTSQYAAIEAMRSCDDEVEEMRTAYNQRRRFLVHEFQRMGIECFEPEGAFYIFPSIKKFGMTSEEFATKLLNEEKVAIVPGSAFGACGEGYLRVSYAYSIEELKEALGRLERFINHLPKKQ